MTVDELTARTTSALDALATALDHGQSDALTGLLRAVSRFHRYSLHNLWLIVAQRPLATRVAGFQTWKSLGRRVRRGEKGIAILAPLVRRSLTRDEDDASIVIGFRVAYVFDVSQTDGAPLPQLHAPTGDPADAVVRLRAAIIADGICVTDAESLGGALGLSRGGAIDVVRGLAPATALVVLAHEYAHELLHRGSDRPASRDTRELEAEAVAFVVGEATGLQVLDAARDYIQLYRGDREVLLASVERIRRTAGYILRAMEGAPAPSGGDAVG